MRDRQFPAFAYAGNAGIDQGTDSRRIETDNVRHVEDGHRRLIRTQLVLEGEVLLQVQESVQLERGLPCNRTGGTTISEVLMRIEILRSGLRM